MSLINFFQISGNLLSVVVTVFVGVFVLIKSYKSRVNKWFVFFNCCIGLWCLGPFLINFIPFKYNIALSIQRFCYAFGVLLVAAFINLVYNIRNRQGTMLQRIVLYGVSVLLISFLPTPLFINGLDIVKGGNLLQSKPGPVYYLYALHITIGVGSCFYMLYKAIKHSSGTLKNQMKFILIAYSIAYFGGFIYFSTILKVLNIFSPAGWVVSLGVLILFYAIIKHHLMDVRIAFTRYGTFVVVYTLFLGLPFFLGYFWMSSLIRIFGINWWMVLLGMSTLAGIIGHFITRYLREKTEAVFFRKQRTYRESLLRASREMVFQNKLDELLDSIAKTIMQDGNISHVEIFLYDTKVESYESVRVLGKLPENRQDTVFFEDNPLISLIFKNKSYKNSRVENRYSNDESVMEQRDTTVLICDDLLKDESILYSNTISLMELGKIRDTIDRIEASLIFPYLAQNEERLGFVILGPKTDGQMYSVDDIEVLETVANQSSIAIKNAETLERQKNTLIQTIAALVKTIEQKDEYTKGHSESVKRYCLWIVEEMSSIEGWEDLRYKAGKIEEAALLHDVGKIAIPDNILKSQESFRFAPNDTEEERHHKEEANEKIKSHPIVGDRILAYIEDLNYHREIIRHHHERWDGTGYPDGQRGTQIPREARIMAVADTYDAITSSRSYDPSRSIEKAIAILEYNKGTQFDPQVVDSFVSILKRRFVFEQREVNEFLEVFKQNGER